MSNRFPRLKNTKQVLVRGYHDTLEDDGFELVTTTGPAVPTLPTAVGTLSIVSSSASDSAAAGKVVIVDYLDTDWQERRAAFLVNGTTSVTQGTPRGGVLGTISAIRVNRVWCNFANVGRIDVSIGAAVLHQVPIGYMLGSTAMYTVPVGQQAVCKGIHVSATEKCVVRLREHLHGEGQIFATRFVFPVNGSLYVPFEYGVRLDRQADDDDWEQTKITWIADANCLTASVTAHLEIGLDLEVSRTDTLAPGFRYS